jgi:enoyl-CoA hydratase/carnithine racemase
MEARRIGVPPSLGLQQVEALAAELAAATSDDSVSTIVLEGTNEAFCRGLDADALLATDDESERQRAVEGYQACLRSIRLGPKPALALVDGPALGGGVGLVAACDVAVATERSSFAFPESLFGLIPAMVLPLALERMRPQQARLWAITASSRTPEEALGAGLVDQLVPHDNLARTGKRWIRQLGRARPAGLARLATFSARAAVLSVEDALVEGGRITLAASGDPQVRKALRNFREHGVLSWED